MKVLMILVSRVDTAYDTEFAMYYSLCNKQTHVIDLHAI
jgi:hypothetical protein